MHTVLPVTFGLLTGATILFTFQTKRVIKGEKNREPTEIQQVGVRNRRLLVTLLNINLTAGAE